MGASWANFCRSLVFRGEPRGSRQREWGRGSRTTRSTCATSEFTMSCRLSVEKFVYPDLFLGGPGLIAPEFADFLLSSRTSCRCCALTLQWSSLQAPGFEGLLGCQERQGGWSRFSGNWSIGAQRQSSFSPSFICFWQVSGYSCSCGGWDVDPSS